MAASDRTMAGKTCLITGATSGIGFVAARELAARGATVVLVGRSAKKCEECVAAIKQATGNEQVESLLGDLSLQRDVRAVAAKFREKHDRLHVLLNNAGAVCAERQVTGEGMEMTLAVNHLSGFLLTNLLLDTIRASAPARIINVSSAAHAWAKIDFDDLQSEKGYSGFPVYGQWKLANVLTAYELARRLEGTGVTANALHPGIIRSGFGRSAGGFIGFFVKAASLFMSTPEQGAATSVYLATSPEVEGITGKYFSNRKPRRSSKVSYDEAVARRLWEASEKLTQGEPGRAATAST